MLGKTVSVGAPFPYKNTMYTIEGATVYKKEFFSGNLGIDILVWLLVVFGATTIAVLVSRDIRKGGVV